MYLYPLVQKLNLASPATFRDLSRPVGALSHARLEEFRARFETFADPSIPKFLYGHHYSTAIGTVVHYLVRLYPFSELHVQYQVRLSRLRPCLANCVVLSTLVVCAGPRTSFLHCVFERMLLMSPALVFLVFQDGHFDVADRLFLSVGEAWNLCTSALSEVKELTPEFFSSPHFLRNVNGYAFGVTQDKNVVVRITCSSEVPSV